MKLSLGEFERAYEMLGIRYDIQRGESFYNDRLAGVVDRLCANGLAEESEGAIVRLLPRHSRARRQAVHHPQKRRRL